MQHSCSSSVSLLKIEGDYPDAGNCRVKQISVSLPALIGPYQDVQALLEYSGTNTQIHNSLKTMAVSHGMNDSGMFQLNFDNGDYLPFEGLDLGSIFTLTFPNATNGNKQNELLRSLSDIILHVNYTIR